MNELNDLLTTDTDLAAFVGFYRRVGIEPTIGWMADEERWRVLLSEDDPDERLIGYSDFYTRALFDAAGRFVSQGFWE